MPVAEFETQSKVYLDALDKVARNRPDVTILKIGKYFCDDQLCRMTRGSDLLYRGNSHLNVTGSLYVGSRLIRDYAGIFDQAQGR
jgi:hypothetical protein